MAGGWGGSRVGAGRKRKNPTAAALHGSRQRGVVPFPENDDANEAPAAPAAGPVRRPRGLTKEQAAVWKQLAPHATAAGTLTAATAKAFEILCRAVVLEADLAKSGAGSADHRGMMQRVEVGLTRFGIAPIGKAIIAPAKGEDPFAEFDAPLGKVG